MLREEINYHNNIIRWPVEAIAQITGLLLTLYASDVLSSTVLLAKDLALSCTLFRVSWF
jgi:hypothetical protein